MKKYFFEATKKQWEKPTEPKQYLCATAKVTVCAENLRKAKVLAADELHKTYPAVGTVIGELRLIGEAELPVDWNYGYGDGRKKGNAKDKKALWAECTK